MLILPGDCALSPFRRARLLNALRAREAGITEVAGQYIYLIDTARPVTPAEHQRLSELLESPQAAEIAQAGEAYLVVPRLGTLSPWASKATDIAHNCGLEGVRRIERGVWYTLQTAVPLTADITDLLHDRMTQTVLRHVEDAAALFRALSSAPLQVIPLGSDPHAALQAANQALGLALSLEEIAYLAGSYRALGRDPTDVELMMFAQANSEHCRHKIFNAQWIIDGKPQGASLFDMIRNTHQCAPRGILSAYHDNAAVIEGFKAQHLAPDPHSRRYGFKDETLHLLMKVETHNHPTAISPFPGAATGSGGEIRDEGATGRGGLPRAGLCGFSVSNLRIPGFIQPWEDAAPADLGYPQRIASALEIMLEGPIGSAAFNNEFGRPGLAGYFRTLYFHTLEGPAPGVQVRGYHKPIMLAGGIGVIPEVSVHKQGLPKGTPIVVLGGPAMLIGLGGGAASSVASGASLEALDYASVQRGNPEMQRRAQEVIERCLAQGKDNPILSIHDVGAGGLSNAVPEIIAGAGRGGCFDLRQVPSAEPGLSPMQLWCNEAQERYVLAIERSRLGDFEAICRRERCPYAVIGATTEVQRLQVVDTQPGNVAVDLPLEVLLGKPPRLRREVTRLKPPRERFATAGIVLAEAVERVLRLPSVAAKTFLITIGDRTVKGLSARDQLVGPWQVPVSDVAVILNDYTGYTGAAMALGERAPIALIDAPASGRMAVGEALTNLAAAPIAALGDIKLSANWMAAAGHPGEDAALFDTVKALGEDLCPALGIAIPVGKDSLSMKTLWEAEGTRREVIAPLSLIISAFASVKDVRRTLTPQLRTDCGPTDLLLIDLGRGRQRLGGSALAQVYGQVGETAPDLDEPESMRAFFKVIPSLNREEVILAYHDRSDGGLFVTLCEMAFAGHVGIDLVLDALGDDALSALFNEELGAVIQVRREQVGKVLAQFESAGLAGHVHRVGALNDTDAIVVRHRGREILRAARAALHGLWAETSFHMQALRDNPDCARQEFARISDAADPGLSPRLSFDPRHDVAAPCIATGARPQVAILREQGVNGQTEMAAAFHRAGFAPIDVHMSDLLTGHETLARFKGLVACGGFAYGDVLGAGGGWAKTILMNPRVREMFADFFHHSGTFGLGVCNGCQMFARIKDLIPGAGHWPRFVRNRSEQFEARLSLVEILPSPSVLLAGMAGSVLPIAVAHGEGRAEFTEVAPETVLNEELVTLRYVDPHGQPTTHYPENPNGSPDGITGLTNRDGRFTILMPHPERVFRTVQHSWHPPHWGEDGPWLRLFHNARVWVG